MVALHNNNKPWKFWTKMILLKTYFSKHIECFYNNNKQYNKLDG